MFSSLYKKGHRPSGQCRGAVPIKAAAFENDPKHSVGHQDQKCPWPRGQRTGLRDDAGGIHFPIPIWFFQPVWGKFVPWSVANFGLVTPLRHGMNLVAKEYI